MRRLLHWTGIALGVLVGLLVLAYAALYVLSEQVVRRAYGGRKLGLMRDAAHDNLSASTDVEIATLYGRLHALPPL